MLVCVPIEQEEALFIGFESERLIQFSLFPTVGKSLNFRCGIVLYGRPLDCKWF